MKKCLAILAAGLLMAGCAGNMDEFVKVGQGTPKVVALECPTGLRSPLQRELQKHGFTVLLGGKGVTREEAASQPGMSVKDVSTDYRANARYLLVVDSAGEKSMFGRRCFKFDYYAAELRDVQAQQILATYQDGGYCDECVVPIPGRMYEKTALMVEKAWGGGSGLDNVEPEEADAPAKK